MNFLPRVLPELGRMASFLALVKEGDRCRKRQTTVYWAGMTWWLSEFAFLASCYDQHAAAAQSLQSCPTLCDPTDSSPPGCPVPGILSVRTLEWVAISFSNAWKWKMSEVAQSCPTLSDPLDCSPPGSSIHGIFQARALEWDAVVFSSYGKHVHVYLGVTNLKKWKKKKDELYPGWEASLPE